MTYEGAKTDNKKGFNFSWRVYPPFTSENFRCDAVTDFELLHETKVIFTNCIGETFTEEDLANNIEVWWTAFHPTRILSERIKNIKMYPSCPNCTTDIFRSKESLLKTYPL